MFYERPDGNYSLPVLWPAIPMKDEKEYEPLPIFSMAVVRPECVMEVRMGQ